MAAGEGESEAFSAFESDSDEEHGTRPNYRSCNEIPDELEDEESDTLQTPEPELTRLEPTEPVVEHPPEPEDEEERPPTLEVEEQRPPTPTDEEQRPPTIEDKAVNAEDQITFCGEEPTYRRKQDMHTQR